MTQVLTDLYRDPRKPGSLGGIERLYKEARKLLPTIKRSQVIEYLQSQEAYPRHKPARHKFKRRRVVSTDQLDLFQADLADMQKFSKQNDGVKYLLTIVDTFTRYGMLVPIKSKMPKEIVDGFSVAFKEYGIPLKIQTDNGGEFKNGTVRTFLKDLGIVFYTTRNDDVKCALAERLIRTIKERLWTYMTEENGFRYIDILPHVVESYNNTVHSSTGYAPELMAKNECDEHRSNLINELRPMATNAKYEIGHFVRIRKKKKTFEKGYETNFTDEIFIITKVEKHPDNIVLYSIKDRTGQPIDGEFHEQELFKVIVDENPPYHRIERVLRTRRTKGKEEFLIRWAGFPRAYDSWESVENLDHVPDTSL